MDWTTIINIVSNYYNKVTSKRLDVFNRQYLPGVLFFQKSPNFSYPLFLDSEISIPLKFLDLFILPLKCSLINL